MLRGESSRPPLEGLRVLELARVLAGPWAGQVLADLGALVTKVESASGDDTRWWGPPYIDRPDGSRDAAFFHATNRGKVSETLDLSTPAGQARILELVLESDVLIENFKVGDLARYGLDYTALATVNPRLIYCSITGFGQDGPYAPRAGYDFVVQGMSGIMDVTGEPGSAPQKMGVAYADIMTGLYSVIAIQAALAERERSGLGQHIDMSLLDVMVGTLANQAMNYLVSGQSPSRMGNAHPNIAPYAAFPARDAWFILAVGNDGQFARFCDAVEIEVPPELITNRGRVDNREAMTAMIVDAAARWKRDDLLAALVKVAVPAGPINSVAQAFDDPQVRHRGMRIDIADTDGQLIPGVRTPIRFSRSSLATAAPAPLHGSIRSERETPASEHLQANRVACGE